MASPIKAKQRRRSKFAGENGDFHFGSAEFDDLGRHQVVMQTPLLREQLQSSGKTLGWGAMNVQVVTEQDRKSQNLVENNHQKTKFTSDRIECSRVHYKRYQLGFAIKNHDGLSGRRSLGMGRPGQKSDGHIPERSENKMLPLLTLSGRQTLSLLLMKLRVVTGNTVQWLRTRILECCCLRLGSLELDSAMGIGTQVCWGAFLRPTPERK